MIIYFKVFKVVLVHRMFMFMIWRSAQYTQTDRQQKVSERVVSMIKDAPNHIKRWRDLCGFKFKTDLARNCTHQNNFTCKAWYYLLFPSLYGDSHFIYSIIYTCCKYLRENWCHTNSILFTDYDNDDTTSLSEIFDEKK